MGVTSREPEHGDARFAYHRVADELRAEINSGTHRPGERLATQGELTTRFGVSRPTVLQALDLLRNEGLIETRRGSGTFVASDPGGGDGSPAVPDADDGWDFVSDRVPAVLLKPYIEEAFEAAEVSIDVFSMTTESLAKRVSDQKDLILENKLTAPRSITARLMLPDPESSCLAIPRPMDPGADETVRARVRERLGKILMSHVSMLGESLYELKKRDAVEEVKVEIGLVAFAPQVKLYILNKRLALQGFYVPEENTVTLSSGSEDVAIYDAYGTGATLFPFRSTADSTPDQVGIVQECRAFFDANWEKLAKKSLFDSSWEKLAKKAEL